jgi:hypothetical protein
MSEQMMSGTQALAKRIRTHALHMTNKGGGSHIGAIFSCADILATLYNGVLPLSMLLLDRDVFRNGSRTSAGICRWLSLLALGVLPPAIFQLVPYMRVISSLMSVLILLVLPVSLAMFCVYTVLTSPKCTGEFHA